MVGSLAPGRVPRRMARHVVMENAACQRGSRQTSDMAHCGTAEVLPVRLQSTFFYEGTVEAGHDDRSQGVAEKVHHGPPNVHQAVDAEQQRQTLVGKDVGRGEGGGQDHQRGSGDAGPALGRHDQGQQDPDLLPQVEVYPVGLGDEQRGDGQVDGGTVEIEAVARGHDEAHHGPLAAEALQLLHSWQQHRFCGRRPEHDEDLLAQVGHEPPQANPGEAGRQAENDHDEHDVGPVHAGDEVPERADGPHSVPAHREGQGSEGAEGREPHHDVDDPEQHGGQALQGLLDGLGRWPDER